MALSTVAKEQDNFLRYAILIVDHSKEALRDLIELNLRNKHLTFEEFLNQNQHEIYHLCYDSKCCQCHTSPPRRKRIICPSQLELLFDKLNKFSTHTATSCTDFCCSKSKVNITTEVLDISLARCLLVNCCLDVFWFTCLTAQGQTLEQFLNSNKHIIYHLWKNNQNCCQCPAGFIIARDYRIITENEWRCMFSNVLLPCINDRKRTSTGTTSVCSVAARPGIDIKDIHPEIQGLILKWCCSVRKSVEKLVEFRNINFGHVKDAKLSDSNFKDFFKKTEECILDIAVSFGKDKNVKDAITNLHSRPIDARLCSHYQNILLENINRNEAIRETINLQHRTTRRSIPGFVDRSFKIRKIEERIDALEKSNAKIKEDIQDIHKQVKEGPKRLRLIDQTSAEIESHQKECTYLETEALRQCIQLLECRNVVILSGREGSGKSRNSLEILRQLKDRHNDLDVFKLVGLHYVSDIVKCNVTCIVLFDDAFDKTSEHFSYEEQVLNHLYSYISQNKVKVIFTMRNYVRHACHRLLATHKIFREFVDIDLNSEKFQLTKIEKEKMLNNYCDINKIMISEGKKDNTDQLLSAKDKIDDNEAIPSLQDQAVVILKREIMNEIIETDPFLGFPECCRLFTENRNNTTLDVSCFKLPSIALVNDIEKLRMKGINNYINGLKYVILIVILTKDYSHWECQSYLNHIDFSLVESNLDEVDCKQIFKICYNMDVEVRKSDIEHVCKVLTHRYLVNRDGAYYFQHKAIQDSVLISYSRINPEAIIPLLSFDHLVDIVRPQNYTEQEDEIVIKISKPYYPKLASKINLSCSCRYCYEQIYLVRFTESTLITENDTDLVYQLLLGLEKMSYKGFNEVQISGFITLLLLRNIGKLDDKMLTVKHTKDQQMLISVTIRDKNITLSIDPQTSLLNAYELKYTDICIWLLKRSDRSLRCYLTIFECLCTNEALKCIQMLLENVDHCMINMTDLLTSLCIFEHDSAVDWVLHSVDNSLIDYTKCLHEIIDEYCGYDMLMHILNNVNHKWLNINEVVKHFCEYGSFYVVELLLKNCDHTLFDYEELFKITIDGNEERFNKDDYFGYFDFSYEKTLVQLILQKPGIICCDINKLFDIAKKCRMNGVMELLFKHDIHKSINVVKIIDDIFEHRDDEGYEYERHCQKIIQLIVKYHSNYANVNVLIEKAFQFGIHDIVELSLEKLDNISYYLDITLDNLRYQKLNGDVICFDTGHGKVLLLLLPKTNYNSIDLNGVMNDVCYIGHSPAIMWLLENKRSYRFNMRTVMNKACYHGDIKLVEYLNQKYNEEDFDYKTAMIKACRHTPCNKLDVCIWLWENIDRSVFDMNAALNTASRCDNHLVVLWILKEVDKGLYDTEPALLYACENGDDETVQLFFDTSSINMLDFQSAIIIACRNEENGLPITKLLYKRADQSTFDINAIFSSACKNYRSDIVQWILETCGQRTTENETNDGHENCIKSLDKHLVDMDWALSCILNMVAPDQRKRYDNETKKDLVWLILKQSDPKAIYIFKLLTETCKKDWIEIFQWILGKVDNSGLNIGEVINVACQNGAYQIVKWSLENIDIQLLDADNIMVESCGFGWLECLVLIQKYCHQYKLHAAMVEACTYGRLDIVKWLLQNYNYKYFNIPLLLKETGRNGWTHILFWLITHFQFYNSDLQIATKEALVNGHPNIGKLMLLVVGRDALDLSTLSNKEFADIKNETVVDFILRNFDMRCLDLSKIMTNACKFGWQNIASFIIDNDSNCHCDSELGLIDISSFITGKHVNCLCDFTSAFNTACMNGEADIVQMLIVNVSHKIFDVQKAMLSTCIKGWDEIALLLLDNFEHTQLDISNALIGACRNGEIYVVLAILRKIKHNLLDIKTALNGACENHMHEELVLWILKNIDHEQLDLTNVRKNAFRHNWRKVQLQIPEVEIDDLNQIEHDTETDYIVIP